MNEPLQLTEIVLRLLAGAIAGGVLGWEREVHEKSAGLRTHMMVSLGAATILVIGQQMISTTEGSKFRLDPQRLLEAVVGGVGFLGAGAIIQSRGSVRGLTTAASVWLSAAVGIACGAGYFVIATISTVLGVGILMLVQVLQPAEMIHKSESPTSDAGEGESRSAD
jgi:putative Mg2+ transporter-C (MgtC) family protein